jgi:hypothetical protein
VNVRRDNTSGRTNLYLESATELWCADIRVRIAGNLKRFRKRGKDRDTVERWLQKKEKDLGII